MRKWNGELEIHSWVIFRSVGYKDINKIPRPQVRELDRMEKEINGKIDENDLRWFGFLC